ncbi:hypothetical protein ACLOJK_029319, partial [Asimina triloba]
MSRGYAPCRVQRAELICVPGVAVRPCKGLILWQATVRELQLPAEGTDGTSSSVRA